MKAVFFAGLILLVVLTKTEAITKEEAREQLIALTKRCQPKAGATDDDIQSLMKHDQTLSPAAKCLKACVMKELGMMSEAGEINYDGFVKLGKEVLDSEDKIKMGLEIVKKCIESAGEADGECEKANAVQLCLHKELTVQGLSPFE